MSVCIRYGTRVICGIGTARSFRGWPAVALQRLPTDPLFYATLTLRNILAGSRYRVTRSDTGDELAAGVTAGTGNVDEVISGVACFANPQEVDITVRLFDEGDADPDYESFETRAFIARAGGEAYILQRED